MNTCVLIMNLSLQIREQLLIKEMNIMNLDQKNAAENIGSPTLVIAGPGTGKTTTLIERYKYLLSKGIAPEQITCCTFSRKAADEIKERILESFGKEASKAAVHTFHSLSIAILKKIGNNVGIGKDLEIWANDFERQKKVREIIQEFNDKIFVKSLSKEELDPSEILRYIDDQRENLLDPEDSSIKASGRNNQLELFYSDIYDAYDKFLATSQKLDFPRMVQKAVEALEIEVKSESSFFKSTKHFLVDEYQDINFSQKVLVDLLLTGGGELWAVGDDLQAIYGWRGSDVRYILEFEKNYPGAKIFTLSTNYRSGEHIIQISQNLSEHFIKKYSKNLKGNREVKGEIYHEVTNNKSHEASSVVDEIQKQIESGKKFSDIAVISRTKERPTQVAIELIKRGIPINLKGGVSTFSDYHARLLITAALIISDKSPSPSMPRVTKDTYSFCMRLKDAEQSWSSKIKALRTYLLNRPAENLSEFQNQQRSEKLDEVSQYLSELRNPVETLSLINATSKSENIDSVFIGTIHSSKGLEWSSVFVLGWEDGHLPQRQEIDVNYYEEERRIAYVAITRAKDFLLLTTVTEDNEMSPFLAEMFGFEYQTKQSKAPNEPNHPSTNDPVKEKIMALLRKVVDAASTEAEKEAAKNRVRKLMSEYGFELKNGKIVKVNTIHVKPDFELSRSHVSARKNAKEDDDAIKKQRWKDYQDRVVANSIKVNNEYTAHEMATGEGPSGSWGGISDLPGFLLDSGYSVRKDGPSTRRRQGILEKVFQGQFELPAHLAESVLLQWGRPGSPERLQKMRNTLNTSMGMQLGKANASQQAIDKWRQDIEFLDEVLANKMKNMEDQ